MAGSRDGSRDRRRQRSPSDSPDRNHDRRQRRPRDDDRHGGRSSRRDEYRSSRRDSSRRRSSRSPSGRTSHRRDDEHRRRERRDRDESPGDDRRRRRHHSPSERRYRRHRDYDEKERSSRRHRSKSRSRSPARRSRSPSSREVQRRGPLPSQNDAFEVAQTGEEPGPPPPEKEKPNFGNTGRLAAESNTVDVNGSSVVLKYHEPPEARKPPAKEPWRLYVFKGEDLLEVMELNERSCWLIGRERLVVDFPLDHPSCSKQHAALQFRFVNKRNEFGDQIGKVKPYLLDLESANGSSVNGDRIPGGRYIEVRDKDVLKFGLSTREYVIMLPRPE